MREFIIDKTQKTHECNTPSEQSLLPQHERTHTRGRPYKYAKSVLKENKPSRWKEKSHQENPYV